MVHAWGRGWENTTWRSALANILTFILSPLSVDGSIRQLPCMQFLRRIFPCQIFSCFFFWYCISNKNYIHIITAGLWSLHHHSTRYRFNPVFPLKLTSSLHDKQIYLPFIIVSVEKYMHIYIFLFCIGPGIFIFHPSIYTDSPDLGLERYVLTYSYIFQQNLSFEQKLSFTKERSASGLYQEIRLLRMRILISLWPNDVNGKWKIFFSKCHVYVQLNWIFRQ